MKSASKQPRGPRGGTTTVTQAGLRRVALYLQPEEYKALRRAAFERELPMSEVMREALRAHLGVED